MLHHKTTGERLALRSRKNDPFLCRIFDEHEPEGLADRDPIVRGDTIGRPTRGTRAMSKRQQQSGDQHAGDKSN